MTLTSHFMCWCYNEILCCIHLSPKPKHEHAKHHDKKNYDTKLYVLVCLYVRMYACVSVHAGIWRCARMYVCEYNLMFLSACMCACMFVCMQMCLFVWVYVYLYVSMYVCAPVANPIIMYIHKHVYMRVLVYACRYEYVCMHTQS